MKIDLIGYEKKGCHLDRQIDSSAFVSFMLKNNFISFFFFNKKRKYLLHLLLRLKMKKKRSMIHTAKKNS